MTTVRRRTGGSWRTLSGAIREVTRPDAPTVLGVVAGDGEATITWLPPNAGGSAISGYQVTRSPGGVVSNSPGTSVTFLGLANGSPYTFTVTATNGQGVGPESQPTAPVVPQGSGVLIRRNASNTGIAGKGLVPADLEPYVGSLSLTTPGQTFVGMDFTAAPTIRADNITFDRCRFLAPVGATSIYGVRWANPTGLSRAPLGTVFVDCELDGNGVEGDPAVIPSGSVLSTALQPAIGFTMIRCDVHGYADGLKPQDNPAGSPILIDECYVHDLVTVYGSYGISHNDILQVASKGARDMVIRRCTLDGFRPWDPTINSRYASSSLMQWGSFPKNPDGSLGGVLQDILIEDNFIEGGGLVTRLPSGAGEVTNVRIRNNRIGLHHRFAVVTGLDGPFEFTGNVWDESGTTDFGTTVLEGQDVTS